MEYYKKIKELTKNVPVSLVDFDLPRDPARTPTQASSNFITNKEQGDWAENLITRAINETSKNFKREKKYSFRWNAKIHYNGISFFHENVDDSNTWCGVFRIKQLIYINSINVKYS